MSARARLTLGYLAIIMAISIAFSVVLYRISTREAETGLQRQTIRLRDLPIFASPDEAKNVIEHIRAEQLRDFQHRILLELAIINLIMLGVGALASNYLADKNLRPLEEALSLQSRFTSDAAHELRTPLTAMKTEIEVALRDKRFSPQEARALLDSNLEEISKLELLTNALLRLAKYGNGQDQTSWSVISVRKLLGLATERVAMAAAERKISIDTTGVGTQRVRGDQEQLAELFVILLDNAIKYGHEGMSVVVSSKVSDGKVCVSVQDHGIGISAAELPHIFERFFRADQSRTGSHANGYGLGLSLAKLIADSHKAIIDVTSQHGSGSTFTLVIPQAAKPAKAPAKQPSKPGKPAAKQQQATNVPAKPALK